MHDVFLFLSTPHKYQNAPNFFPSGSEMKKMFFETNRVQGENFIYYIFDGVEIRRSFLFIKYIKERNANDTLFYISLNLLKFIKFCESYILLI